MLQRNIILFKLYYFFWRFKPLATLMIVYFSQITQSYTTATAVFAIFNISYAIVKIPSGLISDKIGRKSVLIAANVFMTTAFCLLAFSGQLEIKWLLYLFAILWGCGEALSDGTIDAMVYETSQGLNYSDKFYLIYSKSMCFSQLGCAFGAFCAMIITYFLPLQFVAWLSVFPSFFQLIVSFFMIEPNIKKKSITFSLTDIKLAIKQFKDNKKLFFYTIVDIYFSTLGDISHRLESAYFKLFVSNWIINLVRVLKHVWGMIGFIVAPYLRVFSNIQIYFSSITCNMFVRSLALIFNNFYTPFIHMFINFFYATALTSQTDIMQHEYLPEYRATTQAIIKFIKGIYMAGIILLLGIFADIYGIYWTMILLVISRLLGLFLAYTLCRYLKINP